MTHFVVECHIYILFGGQKCILSICSGEVWCIKLSYLRLIMRVLSFAWYCSWGILPYGVSHLKTINNRQLKCCVGIESNSVYHDICKIESFFFFLRKKQLGRIYLWNLIDNSLWMFKINLMSLIRFELKSLMVTLI